MSRSNRCVRTPGTCVGSRPGRRPADDPHSPSASRRPQRGLPVGARTAGRDCIGRPARRRCRKSRRGRSRRSSSCPRSVRRRPTMTSLLVGLAGCCEPLRPGYEPGRPVRASAVSRISSSPEPAPRSAIAGTRHLRVARVAALRSRLVLAIDDPHLGPDGTTHAVGRAEEGRPALASPACSARRRSRRERGRGSPDFWDAAARLSDSSRGSLAAATPPASGVPTRG